MNEIDEKFQEMGQLLLNNPCPALISQGANFSRC